ncbi:ankyrin repeat and SOCS box protein 8-like isoform X2 [Ptychodera flava]|uniref:ankyrin repeat and SOCS box protein 8-like isoform X2 n=1 Tax=Ptychodera flava TaxID=63121 RepID=UPI003969D465
MRCRDPLPIPVQAEIIRACSDDDVRTLKRLLGEDKMVSNVLLHCDVLGLPYRANFGGFEFLTPLQLAAVCGSYKSVEVLLNNRAVVNFDVAKTNRYMYQPLYLALRSSRAERERTEDYATCLELLLDAGADPSLGNERYYGSLLHLAMEFKLDPRILEVFLRNGAEINRKNGRQLTPLHLAVMAERDAESELLYVSTLLKFRPKLNIKDNLGRTAIVIAADYGLLGVVQLLYIHGANPNTVTKTNDTALHLSSKQGHVGIVHFLADKTRHINLCNCHGNTALDLFVRKLPNVMSKGEYEKRPSRVTQCVQTLLNHGATMTTLDADLVLPILRHRNIVKFSSTLRMLINSQEFIDLYSIITMEAEQWSEDWTHMQMILFEQLLSLGDGPRTLRHLCRCVIRRCLGKHCHRNISLLPLPELLKSYLLLDLVIK